MLSENLQALRKAKGLSQVELAERIHVVRQTVSKWEKGLSVPDADLLIRLAEVLGTTVSALLGDAVEPEETPEIRQLSEKLARLNEELARQKERNRKLRRAAAFLAGAVALATLCRELAIILYPSWVSLHALEAEELAIIGGTDGPTTVFISQAVRQGRYIAPAVLVLLLSVIGICKTSKA